MSVKSQKAATKALSSLSQALDTAKWEFADRCLDTVMEHAAAAILEKDSGLLRKITQAVQTMRTGLVLGHDIKMNLDPTAFAWMLAGASAAFAAATLPDQPLENADTRGRILEALYRRRGAPLTTTDLARECERAVATVARQLVILRQEGLVASAPAGRHMRNVITEKGKKAYGPSWQFPEGISGFQEELTQMRQDPSPARSAHRNDASDIADTHAPDVSGPVNAPVIMLS